jgi:RHS repeat-associated protein
VAATDYAYAGGLYDPKARKFLGYRTITMTRPLASGEAARPVVETTYRQDLASYGLPEKTVLRNGANTESKTVVETYAVNAATKPYKVLNTASETTFTDQYAVTVRKERDFDGFGNITQIRDLGRTDVIHDETRTQLWYTPNTSAYIVSLPNAKIVTDTGNAIYRSWEGYYYDNNFDPAVPPMKGNLTHISQLTKEGSVDGVWATKWSTHGYDSYGNRTSAIDGEGSRTERDYDATYHLYPVTERAPKYFATGGQPADARFVSTFTNDVVCGKPATKVDWNGVTETFTYDPFCRSYDYNNLGSGKYVKTRYANEGNPVLQSVAVFEPWSSGTGDFYTQTYYDGLGRPWRVQTLGDTTSGPTRVVDTVYDARSNVAKTSFAYFANETAQWTINSYDWQDRVAKTVNPDGSAKTFYHYIHVWTALSGTTNIPLRGVQERDELGVLDWRIYDNQGLEIGKLVGPATGNYSPVETRTYDALGRLLGVWDNAGATWTYTYDLAGNRLSANDPDLGYWTYAYDSASRLIRQTDARGAVTTLTYDQMGRLLTKRVQGPGEASPTTVATNTYDQIREGYNHNVGLLTSSENGNAKLEYWRSYNGAGGHSVFGATFNGQPNWRTQAMGRQWKTERVMYGPVPVNVGTTAPYWVYNSADLLYSIPDYITSTLYEADGQTKSISYANGVTTEFTYSPSRRWLTRVTTKKGTTVLMDNQYTRNAIGQITAITGLTPSDNWVYTYTTDGFNRLASADNLGNNALDENYSYSINGNLTSRTRMGSYTYPAPTAVRPHAATQIGAKSIAYDANGNMVSDGTRTLVWDRSNQLASVTQGGSAVTFSYGPDGSRVMKNWAFGKTLYAGADIEIDRTTPGAEVYTYYPHPDIKIVTTAAGVTSKYFLHRDHLASVRLVTNVAGNVAEQTSYAAYGETANPAMQTKKGYIGERFDVETGLMYLNARYYDPAFGRFIEKDDQADLGEEGERQVNTILRRFPAVMAKPGSAAAANGTTASQAFGR